MVVRRRATPVLRPGPRRLRKSDVETRSSLMLVYEPNVIHVGYLYTCDNLDVQVFRFESTCGIYMHDSGDKALVLDDTYVTTQVQQEVDADLAMAARRSPSPELSELGHEPSVEPDTTNPRQVRAAARQPESRVERWLARVDEKNQGQADNIRQEDVLAVMESLVLELERGAAGAQLGGAVRRIAILKAARVQADNMRLAEEETRKQYWDGRFARSNPPADVEPPLLPERQRRWVESLKKNKEEQEKRVREKEENARKEALKQQQLQDQENMRLEQEEQKELQKQQQELMRQKEEQRQQKLEQDRQETEARAVQQRKQLLEYQERQMREAQEKSTSAEQQQLLHERQQFQTEKLQQEQQLLKDKQTFEEEMARLRLQQTKREQDALDKLEKQRLTSEQLALNQKQALDLRNIDLDATAAELTQRSSKLVLEINQLQQKTEELKRREAILAAQAETQSRQRDTLNTFDAELTRRENAVKIREGAAATAAIAAQATATMQAADQQRLDRQTIDLDTQQQTLDRQMNALGARQSALDARSRALDARSRALDARDAVPVGGGGPPPGGGAPPPAIPKTVFDFFEFRAYHGPVSPSVADALSALDSLCSFRDTDKSYGLFQTDLNLVLVENELLRSKIAGRTFACWTDAGAYIVENAKEYRMSWLWKNLYYQFGLIAERLAIETLRPWEAGRRERLFDLCRTVCTAAQGLLYADAAEFAQKAATELGIYQRRYNESHGCLRWFMKKTEVGGTEMLEDLHVDIRFLDKILTSCYTGLHDEPGGMIDFGSIEAILLRGVFEVENFNTLEIEGTRQELKAEIAVAETDRITYNETVLDVSNECRELLERISRWKWQVQDDADAKTVYADIYNQAIQRQTAQEPASGMLFLQAVEHHRRYTLHQPRSGEC